MTGAQTLAAFRRALLPALLAALVTLTGVVGLMMTRPPTYQVRVGLIATPTAGRTSSSMDFGQVVNLAMPSLPEFVVADDVVHAVRDRVRNAPSQEALRSAVTVELVPASGVARLSVTTDDPATSRAVLGVILEEIDRAGLLSPVATLKTIGTAGPAASVVGRDPLLATGLGLVAAIAVSLLTVVVLQTVRPRLLTRPDVERIVDDVFEGEAPPPVVEVHPDGRGVDLLAAYLLAQEPRVINAKVVASGPPLPGDLGRQLGVALRKVRAAREAGLALAPLSELGTALTGRAADETAPLPLLPRPPGTGGGDAHLVLTVRLRRTTPVALTTDLITLRTHGAGVAGVAIS